MKISKPLYIWLFLSFILLVIGKQQMNAKFVWDYPPLNELSVTEHYSQDLGFLTQGSHRSAADLGYVQFLQYYGQREEEHEKHEGVHSHYDGGHFEELIKYGQRMIRLDPFFNQAALEVGGSLAFNLKRIDEATQFLKEAIERDPSYWRYRLYMGAILYKEEGADEKLISVLDEAIGYSDCPVLLENILANLHKKYGNYRRAAEVYIHTMKNAPKAANRETAQIGLIEILKEKPYLVPVIEPLLKESGEI